MRKQPEKRLPKKAIQVWRIQNTFDTLLFALIPIGYYFGQAYIFESFYEWITFVLVGIVALYGIVRVGIWPTIQWHRFRYEVFDDEIDIQQGVIIVRRTLFLWFEYSM